MKKQSEEVENLFLFYYNIQDNVGTVSKKDTVYTKQKDEGETRWKHYHR